MWRNVRWNLLERSEWSEGRISKKTFFFLFWTVWKPRILNERGKWSYQAKMPWQNRIPAIMSKCSCCHHFSTNYIEFDLYRNNHGSFWCSCFYWCLLFCNKPTTYFYCFSESSGHKLNFWMLRRSWKMKIVHLTFFRWNVNVVAMVTAARQCLYLPRQHSLYFIIAMSIWMQNKTSTRNSERQNFVRKWPKRQQSKKRWNVGKIKLSKIQSKPKKSVCNSNVHRLRRWTPRYRHSLSASKNCPKKQLFCHK